MKKTFSLLLLALILCFGCIIHDPAGAQSGLPALDIGVQCSNAAATGVPAVTLIYTVTAWEDPLVADSFESYWSWRGTTVGAFSVQQEKDYCAPQQGGGASLVAITLATPGTNPFVAVPVVTYSTAKSSPNLSFVITLPPGWTLVPGSFATLGGVAPLAPSVGPIASLVPPPAAPAPAIVVPQYQLQWVVRGPWQGFWIMPNGNSYNEAGWSFTVQAPTASSAPAASTAPTTTSTGTT